MRRDMRRRKDKPPIMFTCLSILTADLLFRIDGGGHENRIDGGHDNKPPKRKRRSHAS